VSAEPHADALALAGDIAARSPDAVRGAKRLFNLAGNVPLAEGLAAEQQVIRSLIGTTNQVEAVKAYFEKRPARFADPTAGSTPPTAGDRTTGAAEAPA
jgi:enoyl-CoA hydratase/carnithine racemase